jgi:hypothetical protein
VVLRPLYFAATHSKMSIIVTPSGTLNKVVLWRSAIAKKKEVVLQHTVEPGRRPLLPRKTKAEKGEAQECLGTNQA